MSKKERIKLIKTKNKKYSSLVWYARTMCRNSFTSEIKSKLEKIEKLYPKEISELCGKDNNWEHGFNSGMLAGLRWFLTLEEFGIEQAEEEFPMLDT